MGNSALRSVAVLEERPLQVLTGETVVVDGAQWLHRYMSGVSRRLDPEAYTRDDGSELPNLAAIFVGVPSLLRHEIKPVFVFDGAPPEEKQATLEDRREARQEAEAQLAAARERGDAEAIRRYKAQTHRLTPEVVDTSKELLMYLGIPTLDADGPGEAFASECVRSTDASYVMTDDYDALLFGAPQTVRQYSGRGLAEIMDFDATLSKHGLTHEQLVDLALLCGTDYNEGVHGVGPKRGLKRLTQGESIEAIATAYDDTIEAVEALRELFLDPDIATPPTNLPPQYDPDLDTATTFVRKLGLSEDVIANNLSRFPDQ